jgi:L-ascorbate metabolism protein UlaG (beta-lactamase superfamily)
MSNTKNTNRLLPFIKKSRFFNSSTEKPESFLFQTIPSFLGSLYNRKKRLPENKADWVVAHEPLAQSREPAITWIGHATFLIQVNGINILTDPIFGPASAFFPRILPPGIPLNQLPAIDLVLLSHNHRDHCDLATLGELKKNNPTMILLVPAGDKWWLEKKGFTAIEHHWGDTYVQGETQITCTFLPAHHWSAHGIFDRNKSLWGSWMIESPASSKTIYFAGDTAYSKHFSSIAAQFSNIGAALMPIAPETPHPWMRKSHMDTHEAVQAFADLKADHFIPMHWGTFQFGLDTFHGPIDRLQHVWHVRQLDQKNKKLTIAKVGQRLLVE